MWTVDLTVEIKLRSLLSPTYCGRTLRNHSCFKFVCIVGNSQVLINLLLSCPKQNFVTSVQFVVCFGLIAERESIDGIWAKRRGVWFSVRFDNFKFSHGSAKITLHKYFFPLLLSVSDNTFSKLHKCQKNRRSNQSRNRGNYETRGKR